MSKENRGGLSPSPVKNPSQRLELEFDSEASIEGTLERRVLVNTIGRSVGRLQEVQVRNQSLDLLVLIDTKLRALIGHVEQISRQADLRALRQPDRVVGVEVDSSE